MILPRRTVNKGRKLPGMSAKGSGETLYVKNTRKIFTREKIIPYQQAIGGYDCSINSLPQDTSDSCREESKIESDEDYDESQEYDEDEPRPAIIDEEFLDEEEKRYQRNKSINANKRRSTKSFKMNKSYYEANSKLVPTTIGPSENRCKYNRLIIRNADEIPKKPLFDFLKIERPIQWIEETAYLVEFDREGEKYRQRYGILSMPYADRVIFQSSIYKNRPPTVFFQYPSYVEKHRRLENVSIVSQADLGNSYMGFTVSENTYAYKCVCNSLKYAGFRIGKGKYWNILWTGPSRLEIVTPLYPMQKTNHFPGITQIGRKDKIGRAHV